MSYSECDIIILGDMEAVTLDKNMKFQIAARLRELRENKGLTQGDLAKELEPLFTKITKEQKEKKLFNEDNGKGTISSLENVNRSITVDIALVYSEYFHVSVDNILCKDENWQPGYEYIEKITGLDDAAITELHILRQSLQGQFETDILSYLINSGHLHKILAHINTLITSVYRHTLTGINEDQLFSEATEYDFSQTMVTLYREICDQGLSIFFNQAKAMFDLAVPENIEILETLKKQIEKTITELNSSKEIEIDQQVFNASLVRLMIEREGESK